MIQNDRVRGESPERQRTGPHSPTASPTPDPWPYSEFQWPVIQVYLVRKAIAQGARIRTEAIGSLCGNCGSAHCGDAELITFFAPEGEIWPLALCNNCRAEFRVDFEGCGLRLVERLRAHFGATKGNDMGRLAS
jgi:hypothetical protein